MIFRLYSPRVLGFCRKDPRLLQNKDGCVGRAAETGPRVGHGVPCWLPFPSGRGSLHLCPIDGLVSVPVVMGQKEGGRASDKSDKNFVFLKKDAGILQLPKKVKMPALDDY